MRNIALIITVVAVVSFLYRWRYRILNTVLAIGFLRKFILSVILNSPLVNTRFVSRFFPQVANE